MSNIVTAIRQRPTGAATTPSEAETVSRAQAGNAEAREDLARSSRRTAYLFALHLTGSRDQALDVAQDAMLRFFQTLGRFDSSRPVRPWLLRIVRNLVTDGRRRQRVRASQPLPSGDDGILLEPAAPEPDPEAIAACHEMQRLLWRALRSLTPQFREILTLRDYLDLSYDEIAVTLEIPRGTVMSRLHRARQQLRRSVLPLLSGTGEVADA